MWYRHLVRHFGQNTAKISWVVGGADSTVPVTIVGTLPSHVTLAPKGRSLTDLLLAREIEAILTPLPPAKSHASDGPLVHLIPDYRRVEQRYFRETRCYPPQHAVLDPPRSCGNGNRRSAGAWSTPSRERTRSTTPASGSIPMDRRG